MKEVRSATFVAIQVDETTDVSTQTQLVLELRYIDAHHEVKECFFKFLPVLDASIAGVFLDGLSDVFQLVTEKLIGQTYDNVRNAHYVHYYAHQLNLIMQH